MKPNDFKSFLIKRPGAKRGLRLIDLDSFDAFLNKFASSGKEDGLVGAVGKEGK